MALLNNAAALYLGTQTVAAAALGAEQVWPEPEVPENTVAPAITGTLNVGQVLTASPGTWSNFPASYAYQWQEDDGGWTDIGGATSSTFTPSAEGDYRVRVIASNAAGASDPAFSAPVTVTEASTTLATFNPTGATSTCEFSAGNTVLTKTAGSATAQCLTTHPILEKTYFEMRCTAGAGSSSSSGPQLYGGTSALIDYAPLGVWFNEPGCTIDVQEYSLQAYCNQNLPQAFSGSLHFWASPSNPSTHDVHVAVDPATRAVWVSSPDSPSGWYGGGDPAAGTTPTFYVGGSSPIYGGAYASTGRTATLLHPDNYTRPTTPTGFRLGIAGS